MIAFAVFIVADQSAVIHNSSGCCSLHPEVSEGFSCTRVETDISVFKIDLDIILFIIIYCITVQQYKYYTAYIQYRSLYATYSTLSETYGPE